MAWFILPQEISTFLTLLGSVGFGHLRRYLEQMFLLVL